MASYQHIYWPSRLEPGQDEWDQQCGHQSIKTNARHHQGECLPSSVSVACGDGASGKGDCAVFYFPSEAVNNTKVSLSIIVAKEKTILFVAKAADGFHAQSNARIIYGGPASE